MFLILPHNQIVSFEEKTLEDAQGPTTPGNKVGNIVPGEKGSRSSSWQI